VANKRVSVFDETQPMSEAVRRLSFEDVLRIVQGHLKVQIATKFPRNFTEARSTIDTQRCQSGISGGLPAATMGQ